MTNLAKSRFSARWKRSISSVAKEASFLRNLLEELGLHQGPVTIFTDNKSAQAIATNLGIQGRTKHLDIRYHFFKEAIADNKINLEFIGTEDMPADALTKPLALTAHKKCFKRLGMSFD